MSTDLPRRLREWSPFCKAIGDACGAALLLEAADEIERLTETTQIVADLADSGGPKTFFGDRTCCGTCPANSIKGISGVRHRDWCPYARASRFVAEKGNQ